MIRLLTCLLITVLSAGLALAQAVDIDDIQEYLPDGTPNSPYDGQEVTVQGTVYVTAGVYNAGTHYIQDTTGGLSFYLPASGLEIGDVVEVTGIVGDFSGEIQIMSPNVTVVGSTEEPDPLELTPDEVLADYEHVGTYAAVVGIVLVVDTNSFELATDTGENLYVYIDSDTGIDLGAVDVGDTYLVLGPVVVFNGLIELKPRFQSDLVEDPDVVGVEAATFTEVRNLFR
jgi:hypothetical protein